MVSLNVAIDSVVLEIGALCSEIALSTMSHKSVNKSIEADICYMICDEMVSERNSHFMYDEGECMRIFNGVYYQLLDEMRFYQFCQDLLRALNLSNIYCANSYKKLAELVITNIRTKAHCKFSPDRNYVVFPNGVLNLLDMSFHKGGIGTPIHTDVVIDYNYVPLAKSEIWEKFLDQILPKRHFRDILQEFVGACLVDRRTMKIESTCYCIGGGRNGKGVFVESIAKAFNQENVSNFSTDELFRSQKSEYYIASCNGKLVNIITDASRNDISGGDYKRFASGEPFMARHPFGMPFTATRIPLLLACVNDMPVTSDDSLGHTRRMLPVPFEVTIDKDKADTRLPYKLSQVEVKQAVLCWILEGYSRFVKNGGHFTESEEMEVIKKELEMEFNSVLRFLSDTGYKPSDSEAYRIKASDIYDSYKQYCQQNSYKKIVTDRSFAKSLQRQGFEKRRFNNGVYYFALTAEQAADLDILCEGLSKEDARAVRLEAIEKHKESTAYMAKPNCGIDDDSLPF